jgi:hypothetical protein
MVAPEHDRGGVPVLQKPFQSRELARAINAAIRT